MFGFFNNKKYKVSINEQVYLPSKKKEMILQTALNHNLNYPNNCRVGSCGQCKCKLLKGKVKELTETGYILTEEELDQGYILACQSIPKSDIEVILSSSLSALSTIGTIIEKNKKTHDIIELVIKTNQPINYKAGQYAKLTLQDYPELTRSYSFANTPNFNRLHFFIKKMPHGKLSTILHDTPLEGKKINISHGVGDFWLRDEHRSILMVAGGSGLAPILSILKQMQVTQTFKEVTLLFGARTQRDLYCIEEIESLQKVWRAPFHFYPILSAEAENSRWTKDQGFVHEFIPKYISNTEAAYLCGPPVMIDHAIPILEQNNIKATNIFADRFI